MGRFWKKGFKAKWLSLPQHFHMRFYTTWLVLTTFFSEEDLTFDSWVFSLRCAIHGNPFTMRVLLGWYEEEHSTLDQTNCYFQHSLIFTINHQQCHLASNSLITYLHIYSILQQSHLVKKIIVNLADLKQYHLVSRDKFNFKTQGLSHLPGDLLFYWC